MNQNNFFRPTKGKLILPALFLIWAIYYSFFSPLLGRSGIYRFETIVTNIRYYFFVIIVLFVLYLLSCLIYSFFRK